MDFRFLAFAAVIAALLAIGITRMFFSNRERGLSASQWLLAVLLWAIMMLLVYWYQRYRPGL